MNDRLFIGIDNGISGACAALSPEGNVVYLAPLPVTKVGAMTVLDAAEFQIQLASLCDPYRPHILIEPAQLFSAGIKGIASTWMCWGALRAILEISGYSWEPVNPQRWQREMFVDHVRAVDQKEDKKAKQASILVAGRLFPGTKLVRTEKSRVPDSGLADALLIAEYARRKR
jgi:hypothetical protein